MTSNRPRQALHFYVLPRPVAVQIFTLLPLPSILACSRTSRRIHTLITRSREMQPLLFHSPPPPHASAPGVVVSLHPVFSRLDFSAFHAAKAVRVGSGRFLLSCGRVRDDFATAPAMREVIVRVISGGEWPLDVEIAVAKQEGVTVWDVVEGVTGLCVSLYSASERMTDIHTAASTSTRRSLSATISGSSSARSTNGIRRR